LNLKEDITLGDDRNQKMDYKDYYKTLGVDKTANSDDIEKAYRKLARRFHPDVNPGDKEVEAKYHEISEAREVLTDPDKRAKYDRLGVSWRAHPHHKTDEKFDWAQWVVGFDAGDQQADLDNFLHELATNKSGDYSDFYEAIFSKMEKVEADPQTSQDITREVEISLEEAFTGTTRILRVADRRLEVKIPRGVDTGTKIRVRGEGIQTGEDSPKGDLYLYIKTTPHELFERQGDDLHLELPVDLFTAVLGGEAIVPMFKGKVKLRIPPETQSGRVFRLKEQGMPRLKQPDARGDLYAKVMIHVPENLTDEEIALFEELADIRGL
jgi:curved DNA-binding protein